MIAIEEQDILAVKKEKTSKVYFFQSSAIKMRNRNETEQQTKTTEIERLLFLVSLN